MASKKSDYFPIQLNLNEVSSEPLEFNTSRASGELNQVLSDLIGEGDYSIHLSFEKLGNAYMMKGDVRAEMPLTCSDCGGPYVQPLNTHFEELLVIQSPYQKGDHASRNNHAHEWEQGQPQCTYLESSMADLGELVHEQIALLEPFRPSGKDVEGHTCEDLSTIKREWLSVGKDDSKFTESPANPFKALERLKLKS